MASSETALNSSVSPVRVGGSASALARPCPSPLSQRAAPPIALPVLGRLRGTQARGCAASPWDPVRLPIPPAVFLRRPRHRCIASAEVPDTPLREGPSGRTAGWNGCTRVPRASSSLDSSLSSRLTQAIHLCSLIAARCRCRWLLEAGRRARTGLLVVAPWRERARMYQNSRD